jgi:glycosyl transferase family 25
MLKMSESSAANLEIHVRYIAMHSETKRIAFMEEWLAGEHVSFYRSSGVTVSCEAEVASYDAAKRIKRFGFGMTVPEIGCFLAHKACWEASVAKNIVVLILESDVSPVQPGLLRQLLQDLSQKVEEDDRIVIRLHGIFPKNEKVSRTISILSSGYQLVQTLFDPMGAGAYVVTPYSSAKLLESSLTFFEPVDVFLSHTWRYQLPFRTVKPYPFEVAEFPSVIGEDRRRPRQSLFKRLSIELNRAFDDLRRLIYLPRHFWD